MKTARLATGRELVVGFDGGYHGTGLAALAAGRLAGVPRAVRALAAAVAAHSPTARVPRAERAAWPAWWWSRCRAAAGWSSRRPGSWPGLRDACDRAGALLVVDEIFTGLGRTGRMWMCQAEGVRPDLLVCGKALAGGLPLSACLGSPQLMDRAWGGHGEVAIDTHTHLGSPLSCAAALAVLDELEQRPAAGSGRPRWASGAWRALPAVRGRGLALGLPCRAAEACERAARAGRDRGAGRP